MKKGRPGSSEPRRPFSRSPRLIGFSGRSASHRAGLVSQASHRLSRRPQACAAALVSQASAAQDLTPGQSLSRKITKATTMPNDLFCGEESSSGAGGLQKTNENAGGNKSINSIRARGILPEPRDCRFYNARTVKLLQTTPYYCVSGMGSVHSFHHCPDLLLPRSLWSFVIWPFPVSWPVASRMLLVCLVSELLPANPLHPHDHWMKRALDQAVMAFDADEVPVGAVVVYEDRVIAEACNQRETLNDPTAHAEMIAITQAAESLGSWRLLDCTLYVTLEPCPMCAGAIVQARVPFVVYGASDPKAGACDSLFHITGDIRLNHQSAVLGGVMQNDCQTILQEFFRQKRAQGKK